MADLYEVLGFTESDRENITQDQIRKAYLKLVLKHHPDKGGDETNFKKICNAYTILYDSEKRKQYDEGNNTYQFDEAESNDFADRQRIIISQLLSAITKIEPEYLKATTILGGAASLILGIFTFFTEDKFDTGFRSGVAISISSLAPQILSLVDEEYREAAGIYLQQFIDNIIPTN
ncbi:hypothetical protein ACTFIW_004818 [Dictyostelium discoideum]